MESCVWKREKDREKERERKEERKRERERERKRAGISKKSLWNTYYCNQE